MRFDLRGRRATRAMLAVGAFAFFTGGAEAVRQTVEDARAAAVTAAVVSVRSEDAERRVYHVRFADAAGRTCETEVSADPAPDPRAAVPYSASDPCAELRAPGFAPPWPFLVVAGAGVVLALAGMWLRRPGPRAKGVHS
jgi:hypothetical protein